MADEVKEECSKYGPITRILVHKALDRLEVQIFVLFSELSAATAAQGALDKRWFAGRVVQAQFYDPDKFEQDILNDL